MVQFWRKIFSKAINVFQLFSCYFPPKWPFIWIHLRMLSHLTNVFFLLVLYCLCCKQYMTQLKFHLPNDCLELTKWPWKQFLKVSVFSLDPLGKGGALLLTKEYPSAKNVLWQVCLKMTKRFRGRWKCKNDHEDIL